MQIQLYSDEKKKIQHDLIVNLYLVCNMAGCKGRCEFPLRGMGPFGAHHTSEIC